MSSFGSTLVKSRSRSTNFIFFLHIFVGTDGNIAEDLQRWTSWPKNNKDIHHSQLVFLQENDICFYRDLIRECIDVLCHPNNFLMFVVNRSE